MRRADAAAKKKPPGANPAANFLDEE